MLFLNLFWFFLFYPVLYPWILISCKVIQIFMKFQQKSVGQKLCGAQAISKYGYKHCAFLYCFNITCFIPAGLKYLLHREKAHRKLSCSVSWKYFVCSVSCCLCIQISCISSETFSLCELIQFRKGIFKWILKANQSTNHTYLDADNVLRRNITLCWW